MNFPILVANRLIKIFAHVCKYLSYPFHWVLPNKRFEIPYVSKPVFKTNSPSKISRIFWQTNFTNKVSLPVYINYLFNRLLSLNYEYRLVNDDEILNFITSHCSEDILSAYKRLNDGAARADFWRLLVLYHHGGVYMDIDGHFVWPLSLMIKDTDSELFMLTRDHSYTNHFFACAAQNPILKDAIELVKNNIATDNIEGGVYEMTGPTPLMKALEGKTFNTRPFRLTCLQGSFTNEYFQYIDKPRGKWIYAKNEDLLKKKD